MRKFGWKRDTLDTRDIRYAVTTPMPLPESSDLTPYMPSVWDQKDLGSCTAHAGCAAVSFCQTKEHPQIPYDPSRLFLYYNERVLDGDPQEDNGSTLRTAAKSINRWGVCQTDLWSYDESKFAVKPPKKAFQEAILHKSIKYARVNQTLYALQTVLTTTPIIFGFDVFASFMTDAVAKTGIMPFPAKNEQIEGGHAVTMVGYDNQKSSFLVRNSWGSGWGDPNHPGHFWMPYSFAVSGYASDFWVIQTIA